MRRSTEFTATVRQGVQVARPDLVVHALREPARPDGPRIGFVVSKSVGTAADRHRVARRLRHAARTVIPELDRADRVVVRALPSSRDAGSGRLEQQITGAVRRSGELLGRES